MTTNATKQDNPADLTTCSRKPLADRDGQVTITLREADCGAFLLVAEDGREVLIQTDWDYPGVASTFGWSSCFCGATDGTVDCKHRKAREMIAAAREFLMAHIGDTTEDPGYF